MSAPRSESCCCRFGAAVAGEYPEFACPRCPVHTDPDMADVRDTCRRHRRKEVPVVSARTRKPSDVARERGIVLDETTAPLVGPDDYSTRPGECDGHWWPAGAGDVLIRHRGYPVAEIVTDVDTLHSIADWVLAGDNSAQGVNDDLHAIADRLLHPGLVRAWHDQHPDDTEEAP